jgi:hypothetical protein
MGTLQSLAYAFRRSIRQSIDQESNADESEEKQDSGLVLEDGCSPMSGLSKRLADNKAHRRRLAGLAEEPSGSQLSESPYQPMSTGGTVSLMHDGDFEAQQFTPACGFIVRQDSSLGGSVMVSAGQDSRHQRTGNVLAEDTACSAPAQLPMNAQTDGAAGRPVLSPIAVPPSNEQLQIQPAADDATTQPPTQSTTGSSLLSSWS